MLIIDLIPLHLLTFSSSLCACECMYVCVCVGCFKVYYIHIQCIVVYLQVPLYPFMDSRSILK